MAKTTFTAEQLEEALEGLKNLEKAFPDYPLSDRFTEYSIWSEGSYPLTLRKVGDDQSVTVGVKDFFGGEEGGDHRMYVVLQVGWGADTRYFEKTGEYNSWDDSYWDGGFCEVVSQEVKKVEWVAKK